MFSNLIKIITTTVDPDDHLIHQTPIDRKIFKILSSNHKKNRWKI